MSGCIISVQARCACKETIGMFLDIGAAEHVCCVALNIFLILLVTCLPVGIHYAIVLTP